MAINFKKIFLITLVSSTSIVVLICIALSAFIWWYGWPSMDDGPFHGEVCELNPKEKPDQTFNLWDGLKLEVHNKNKWIKAPVVTLKKSTGEKLWSIYATAYEQTQVDAIEFKEYSGYPFKTPRIKGIVYWTFGAEATWWYIKRNGELKEYWYSW
jgi:hypothetical protein